VFCSLLGKWISAPGLRASFHRDARGASFCCEHLFLLQPPGGTHGAQGCDGARPHASNALGGGQTHTEPVEDRPPAPERPPSEYVDLPFGYVVAISFEEQPAGMCLHVSVSGPWPKVAPNMVVCAMIFNALDVPSEADHVWTEEFLIDGKLGGRVFNVVWLVEPVVGGIAGTL
jgi:hypothetical protein